MFGSKPPMLKSKRLSERLQGLRSETVIVPDWKRIRVRAIPIVLTFTIWVGDFFGLWVVPRLVADAALALSAFLGAITYLELSDRRLWLEKPPSETSDFRQR